jgi:hypothetical protein
MVANFRSGYLYQGTPLGATPKQVTLTADDTVIDVMSTPIAMLLIGSDNTTAANRTFTITSSTILGHQLDIIFISGASTAAQLVDTGNVQLNGNWEPTQYQSISLQWNGDYWVEIGRSNPTVSSPSLTSAQIIVGNASNVPTAVDMTGDVTITNAGVTAIGANKVTASMLATNLLVEATGTLSQANIVAMNGTPVTLVAAPGAGKAIIVDEIELFHDYSTAAYTSGGDLSIEYATSGTDVLTIDSTFVTGAADANTVTKPTVYTSSGTDTGFDLAANTNKAIQATNATGAFANGNAANIIKWRIRYHVVTVLT